MIGYIVRVAVPETSGGHSVEANIEKKVKKTKVNFGNTCLEP